MWLRWLAKNDVPVIVAAISPYAEARERAKELIGPARFFEVHADCTLDELARRDVKGLYKKALAGEIPHFTGVSDPYEAPTSADVRVDSATMTLEESAQAVLAGLKSRGLML
ncbi:MAG: adenylyl-sulfate kinase [Armatimonas sp.]